MTAYANLRNVLANAYACNYYTDANTLTTSEDLALCDALIDAFNAYEDDKCNKCRTNTDWNNVGAKIEAGIRRAASTASKGDKAFIVAVIRDYLDADFYGLKVTA